MNSHLHSLRTRIVQVGLMLMLVACSGHSGTSAPATAHSLTTEEWNPGNRQMSAEAMATLRVNAWRLLGPFTLRTEGLPPLKDWKPRHRVMALDEASEKDAPVAVLQRALEQDPSTSGEPTIYEMTFFNEVASEYIRTEALRIRSTTDVMLSRQRRDIEFPQGSVAVKTFWRHMDSDRIDIRKWDWNAIGTREQLPMNLLSTRCVTKEKIDGCVKAADSFYTIRVQNPGDFGCPSGAACPRLKKGDLLLLVAMHIASKQMPEWLWATFWWRDSDARSGDFWTCDDAQRKEALNQVPLPWSNYSMDVTASFTMEKPMRPRNPQDASCGIPGEIGNGNQWLAAYNPFVEAFFRRGLKSSCIDCHSRASTNRATTPFDTVPAINAPPGPALRDLEGHLRLDYMWSLRHGLQGTEFPHDRWPLPR
jgi:hypothetical protein